MCLSGFFVGQDVFINNDNVLKKILFKECFERAFFGEILPYSNLWRPELELEIDSVTKVLKDLGNVLKLLLLEGRNI